MYSCPVLVILVVVVVASDRRVVTVNGREVVATRCVVVVVALVVSDGGPALLPMIAPTIISPAKIDTPHPKHPKPLRFDFAVTSSLSTHHLGRRDQRLA